MLTIRLSKIGKKNKPMYRLIISEKARDPYGRALEILGSYNPYTKELNAKNERIKYWISKGSQMSPTVNNLLIEKNVIEGDKVKASKARKKKKDKEEGKKESKSETPPQPSDGAKKEGDKQESADVKVEKNNTDSSEKPKAEEKTEEKTKKE